MHARQKVDLLSRSSPDLLMAGNRRSLGWSLASIIALAIAADFLAVLISGALTAGFYQAESLAAQQLWTVGALAVASVALYGVSGAYRTNVLIAPYEFASRRCLVLLCVWSALLIVAFGLKRTTDFSRLWLFSWLLSAFVIICAMAIAVARLNKFAPLALALKQKYVHIKTVGSDHFSVDVGLPVQTCVVVSTRISTGVQDAFLAIDLAIQSGYNVLLTLLDTEVTAALAEIPRFRLCGADILLDIRVPERTSHLTTRAGARLRPLRVLRRPISDFDIALKRLLDIVISAAGICVLSPLFLALSILIILDDGWPVLFIQPRRGYRQRVFHVWKFRTMRVRDSDIGAARQASHDDERITRAGRMLRATNLDEIPQLFNVLQGKMSLVGPRPHALEMNVDGIPVAELMTEYAIRHNIRPGMTGLAQVRGYRGPVHDIEHLHARVESDIEYIERWTAALDLRIIAETVKVVVFDPTIARLRQEIA